MPSASESRKEYGTIEAGKCANMVLSKKDGTIVRVFSGQETEQF